MNKTPLPKQSINREHRQRSVTSDLPMNKAQTDWCANVEVNGLHSASARRCPKCQGFLMSEPSDLGTTSDIKCVNCGWQAQWGGRLITESDEFRSIRRLATQFSAQPDLHRALLFRFGQRSDKQG